MLIFAMTESAFSFRNFVVFILSEWFKAGCFSFVIDEAA